MNWELLPYDCFVHIFSFIFPKDACNLALVSSEFQLAANSNLAWEKFLPYNYRAILSELDSPLTYSSKKDLFLKLCNPQFIDGGKKTFSIQKSTGKTSFMLSARELSIAWSNSPLFWSWKPLPQSRFAEVAELITIWWLEIQCKTNNKMLSPRTFYGAYLIVKFADRTYGLDYLPSEISFEIGKFKSNEKVKLSRDNRKKTNSNQIERLRSRGLFKEKEMLPCEREDGWFEIEIGSFYNEGNEEEELKMGLKEVKGQHLRDSGWVQWSFQFHGLSIPYLSRRSKRNISSRELTRLVTSIRNK